MTVSTETVELHPVPVEEEAVLVGHEADDPVEPFIGEFGHRTAPGTDEVAVVGVSGLRLEAPDPFPEVVRTGQPRLDEDIEGAIDRRRPDLVPLLSELSLQRLGREVRIGGEERGGDEVALPGDGKPVIAEPAPEPFQQLRGLLLAQAHLFSW